MTRHEARRLIRALILRFEQDLHRLRDPFEGLQDLASLDLDASAQAAVAELGSRVMHRIDLLKAAIKILQDLLASGYPADVRADGTPEPVLRNLTDQDRTLRAAIALFETLPAVDLGLTYSPPERK